MTFQVGLVGTSSSLKEDELLLGTEFFSPSEGGFHELYLPSLPRRVQMGGNEAVAELSLSPVKGTSCTFQPRAEKFGGYWEGFLRTQKRGGWKSLVHSSAQL